MAPDIIDLAFLKAFDEAPYEKLLYEIYADGVGTESCN